MIRIQKATPWPLLFLGLLILVPAAGAQDEVRLTDGGVLEGQIIRETETGIELKHRDFGVIKIPRSRIARMGPYGTLDEPSDAATGQEDSAAAARRRDGNQEPGASRLDLDYEPERYQPVPIPGAEEVDDSAALETEMEARPELARLYETLINRDVVQQEAAQLLFSLNEKWEADPDSLSPLENRIVETLLGKTPEPASVDPGKYRNPPPGSLAPIVDEIREKLKDVEELSYRERYTVNDGDGRIVMEYERQISRPDLIAGTGKMIEHVEAAEVGKAIRYFGDGHMLWLLTRGETNAAVDDGRGANPFGPSAGGAAGDVPRGTRAEFGEWAAAGFPLGQMTRANLLLVPFKTVDLATLELVSEDKDAWVLRARIDSPAFDPMKTTEFRMAKSTGLLESMELSGDAGSARLEISEVQINPGLPPATFVVPEAPTGQGFQIVQAPGTAADALAMLGAL